MSLPAVVLLAVLLLDVGEEVCVALLLAAGLLHGDLTVLANMGLWGCSNINTAYGTPLNLLKVGG